MENKQQHKKRYFKFASLQAQFMRGKSNKTEKYINTTKKPTSDKTSVTCSEINKGKLFVLMTYS